jgi:TetR/AcrR family transcriptional regulator, cholesterol catabolism regulator
MNNEQFNIISRVHSLYKKYGIKSVTMDDVAKELGLSKKTIYQYFLDKRDLVEQVFDYEITSKQSCFAALKEKTLNAIEELFEVNIYVAEMLKEYNPSTDFDLKKYYPEIFHRRNKINIDYMYDGVLANLKKGIVENLYRKEIDPVIITKLHISRILSMAENRIFTIEEFTAPKVLKELFIYHIRGIANENGIRELELQMKKYKI